jgi:hypothetical protein
MVVGSIVKKIGGVSTYKITAIEGPKAVCILWPHGNPKAKFTFKLSELEEA